MFCFSFVGLFFNKEKVVGLKKKFIDDTPLTKDRASLASSQKNAKGFKIHPNLLFLGTTGNNISDVPLPIFLGITIFL